MPTMDSITKSEAVATHSEEIQASSIDASTSSNEQKESLEITADFVDSSSGNWSIADFLDVTLQDFLNFAESIVTAWPPLILITIYLFRKSIRGLVDRIISVSGIGTKIVFETLSQNLPKNTEFRQTHTTLKETQKPDKSRNEADNDSTIKFKNDYERLLDTARKLVVYSPAAAFMHCFMELEESVQELCEISDIDIRRRTFGTMTRELHLNGKLDDSDNEILSTLYELRNVASHGKGKNLEKEEVADAIDAAIVMTVIIRSKISKK